MIRYGKYALGFLLLFTNISETVHGAATAAAELDRSAASAKSPKMADLEEMIAALRPVSPPPSLPVSVPTVDDLLRFAAAAAAAASSPRLEKADSSTGAFAPGGSEEVDVATEVRFVLKSTTQITYIKTLEPIKDLIQKWTREGLIPLNPEASVRVTLIGLATALNTMMVNLQEADKNCAYPLPHLYFPSLFAATMPDETQVIYSGYPPVATTAPLEPIIAEFASTMPVFNPKVGVRRNMAALYEAVCTCHNRYRMEVAKRTEILRVAAEGSLTARVAADRYKAALLEDLAAFEREKTEWAMVRVLVSERLLPNWDKVKDGLLSPASSVENFTKTCNAVVQLIQALTILHQMKSSDSLREPELFTLTSYIDLGDMEATKPAEGTFNQEAFMSCMRAFDPYIPVLNLDRSVDHNMAAVYRALGFLLDKYKLESTAYRGAVEKRRRGGISAASAAVSSVDLAAVADFLDIAVPAPTRGAGAAAVDD